MSLEIRQLTGEMKGLWDDLCMTMEDAWLRHSSRLIDYTIASRFDGKSRDISFFIFENDRPLAIVPLVLQTMVTHPDFYEFAMLDTNCPLPAMNKDIGDQKRMTVLKAVFDHIDKLAEEYGISYSRLFYDSLTGSECVGAHGINLLPRFGYSDSTIMTSIVDLSVPENALMKRMRKGHRADILFASRQDVRIEIYSGPSIPQDKYAIYKKMHFKDAGRQTRPDASWEMFLDIIKRGQGLLALTSRKGPDGYCAGALCLTYKNKAYYLSGAKDPDYEGIRGIGHFMQWEIMRYLKSAGFLFYEIGWVSYPVISHGEVSAKDVDIAHFKTGFGGALYPLLRGEKFYSRDLFHDIWNKRVSFYSSAII